MTSRRPALLGVLGAALLAFAGCSGHARPAATGTSPAASPTLVGTPGAVPTAPVTAQPTGLASPTPSPTPSCHDVATHTLGDGTWSGPVTLDVRAHGGHAAFTSTRGRGTMAVVVRGGQVVDASWRVRWTSSGEADNGQAAAHLALTGRLAGLVSGSASRPVVNGTWQLTGTATVTKPVHTSGPIDETGRITGPMAVTSATCGGEQAPTAAGTYRVTFTSKDAEATFTGNLRWTATRRD